MFFVLRGTRLTYSRGADRTAGGGVIQLAGCRVAEAAPCSGAHVLSIEHSERGTRRLQCPSAESCREWVRLLRSASAAAPDHSLPPLESASASDDPEDTRVRLAVTLGHLRAHGTFDDGVTRQPPANITLKPRTLVQALAERDEAQRESAFLLEQVQTLSRNTTAAAGARAEAWVSIAPVKSGAAEEAIAALERERKESVRISEEKQALQRQVSQLSLTIQDLEAEAEVRAR